MRDDSKQPAPTKLRLSRDLKNKAAVDTRATETPTPSTQPEREQKPAPTSQQAKAASLVSDGSEVKNSDFNPQKPFGNSIKDGEIKASPASKPAQQTSAENNAAHAGDFAAPKTTIPTQPEQSPKETAKRNSALPSVFILLLLLLFMAGAGYGLWRILQPADNVDGNPEHTTQAAPGNRANDAAKPKGPIAKAKKTIAEVPVADIDALRGDSPDKQETSDTEEVSEADTASQRAQRTPAISDKALAATKQKASDYLSGLHIDGVREGERPMIIIAGKSYVVGDIVQAETGLKFDGLRDGRLAFRDSQGIVYLKSF